MPDYDLQDRISTLESLAGDGTELVTLSVPPDDSLQAVRQRIGQEHASAAQIKSDRTRDRVQRALDRIERTLRRYETTPDTGLVVYAGVVDGDLVSYVFDDLPAPVPSATYRCDDRFDLDPLRAVAEPEDTYGLLVVERGGGAVGELVGQRVVPVETVESHVMGQSRAGGQSAQRFARERERQKEEFFDSLASVANAALLGEDPVTGVAVGGTLATVGEFVDGDYLDYRLRDRILGTYAVEYGGEQGLRQLVDRAEADLLDAERRAERETLEEFFRRLRDDDPVAYGDREVDRAIDYGAVDTALVSADRPRARRNEIEKAVAEQGGDVRVVSTETERGAQFVDAFGGIGALCRFPVR